MGFEVRAPLGVGIVSATPDRLVDFYAGCLGFEPLKPIVFPSGAVHRLRAGSSILRVFQPGAEPEAARTDRFDAVSGVRYFTLVVDDVQAVLDACRAFGLDTADNPTQTGPGSYLAMIQDPEGNWIEVQSR
jgi:lactoylglutathione lyase